MSINVECPALWSDFKASTGQRSAVSEISIRSCAALTSMKHAGLRVWDVFACVPAHLTVTC